MISERDGQLLVSGPMNQQTAAELLERGRDLVRSSDHRLNLRDVSAVDSSALAVVLAWMRTSRAAGRQLAIVEPPKAFTSLASLYGIEEVLFPPRSLPEENRE
jgi:phospholipid transport system transporter-binding protein